jgi:prepilin-type N-terminal cleavage/methylation domain-containing protein
MEELMRRRRTPIPRRAGARAGFTLVEVTIALGILAVGMLSLALMQLHAMRAGSQGRHTSQAAVVARDQLERFQRLNWADMGPTAGWTAPVNVTNVVQATPANRIEQTYRVQWRITDLVAGRTRNVDVRVAWNEAEQNNPKTLTFSSVRYNW